MAEINQCGTLDGATILQTNERLSYKYLPGTNTLAYFCQKENFYNINHRSCVT